MKEVSVAFLAGLVTVGGGLLAFRAEGYRALVFAFCAGALIGTALLALVPEAFELLAQTGATDVDGLALACVAGFFLFYALENLPAHQDSGVAPVLHYAHGHTTGLWAAAGIVVHSFLDGVAIAQGFATATLLGWTVAIGVAMHKFADGVSIVGVMRGTHQRRPATVSMLGLAALAPIAGALLQPLFAIPAGLQALLFAWFAGVFLYLGATSLLPAAHEAGRSRWIPFWALAGAALIYCAQRLVDWSWA